MESRKKPYDGMTYRGEYFDIGGLMLYEAVTKMIDLSNKRHRKVFAEFNGKLIEVHPGDTLDSSIERFTEQHKS